MDFLRDAIDRNQDIIPEVRSVSRMGWNREDRRTANNLKRNFGHAGLYTEKSEEYQLCDFGENRYFLL